MQKVITPIGQNSDQIDVIIPGDAVVYSLEADTPFSFPPVADFPNGGVFSIRVPAGAVVSYQRTEDGPGYTLDPGHWPFAFLAPDSRFLVATADVDIQVLQQLEVGSDA